MGGTAERIISNIVNRAKGLDDIHDDVGTLDGIVDVPAKDSTADVQMSDVVGKKDDTAVDTVTTTKSLMAYLKGVLNLQDVPAKDATTDAHVRDVVGKKDDTAVTTVGIEKSLMAYLKGALGDLSTISGYHTVATKDASTDAQMRDVVGKKDDTAVTVVGTTKTITAYVKGIMNDLSNATDGLGALKTLVDAVGAKVTKPEVIANIFDADMGYWTEVDTPGRATVDYTNERIAIANLDDDEDVYVYKATGANVTDFILDFEYQVLDTSLAGSYFCIGLADSVGTAFDVSNGLYVLIAYAGANDHDINIGHMTGGSIANSALIETLTSGTTYYGRLIRRGSYCLLCIYSDRIRETHVTGSPVEYKDVTPTAFTHLYPMSALDSGGINKEMDAYVERIKLVSAPDIDKYLGKHIE